MDKENLYTVKRYNDRIKTLGFNSVALGWTRPNVEIRLKALINCLPFDISGMSVLDVGCGLGDLYVLLKDRDVNYTGIDINQKLIDHCVNLNFGCNFICMDIHEYSLHADKHQQPNVVFLSGLFNHKREDKQERKFLESTIRKAFELSTHGVVFNVLTDKVDYFTEHNFNHSPNQIINLAYSLSNCVILDNTVLKYELSVGVFKAQLDDKLLVNTFK